MRAKQFIVESNHSGIDPRATTQRIRAIQAELKQPVDSARRTSLRAELEKLVANMQAWQSAMPVKEATGEDWHSVASQVGSDPNDVIPEVPADFNPTIAYRKITLLKNELRRMAGLKYEERAKIVTEIRKLENQISLWMAQRQSDPANQPTQVEPDEGAPYIMYTAEVQIGQPVAQTLKGARNAAKRAIMQQKANNYIIVTNNQHKVVYSWSQHQSRDLPDVGDTYQPPKPGGEWQGDTHSPRYPAGHPHAGAVMPPRI